VQRVWTRTTDWVGDISDAIDAMRPDVVHVQHSPGIFGMDARIGDLCRRVRRGGAKAVVTLHTVHSVRSATLERLFAFRKCYQSLAAHCDAVVVHQRRTAVDSLTRAGVPPSHIEIIPHGTSEIDLPSARDARAALVNRYEGPLLLAFGFIHPQKNLHTLIGAMHRLSPTAPRPRLLVVGSLQNRAWFNVAYLAALRAMVRRFALRDRVEFRIGYVPDDDVVRYFAAADLVMLPHWQSYGSASGVLHTAVASRRLVMVSDSPKFDDVARLLGEDFCAPVHSARIWARRIGNVLASETVQRDASARLADYAESTRWDSVARATAVLYERLGARGQRGRP